MTSLQDRVSSTGNDTGTCTNIDTPLAQAGSPPVHLLPCPFCGGEARDNGSPKGLYGQIVCSNPDCFGPHTTAGLKRDSIIQWNTRAAGWRDISTAPKDGTHILAIRQDWWEPVNGNHRWVYGNVFESYFDTTTDRFESYGLKQPTHWMPLPAPPNDDDGSR